MKTGTKNSYNSLPDIQINNKKHRSPQTYGSVAIWIKMYEYYKYYYNKYANKV